MPESPEVAELASFLATRTAGRTITGMEVALTKVLRTSPESVEALAGRRIVDVQRRGKMLEIATGSDDGRALSAVVHFGHDGWVLWHDAVPAGMTRAGEATLLARVRLDDGSGFDLTDAGQWKALTIHVVTDPVDVAAVAKLGPDPLTENVDAAALARIVGSRRKQIKALLQDQAAFAGIGNAYSDEILHAARLSPVAHGSSLSTEETARLAESMGAVLRQADADRHGVSASDLRAAKHAALRVHRRSGQACPICGDRIREHTFSGAAAQYCPTCQTGGITLTAD